MFETDNNYPLYKIGWKAFQDLCIVIAEDHLHRPVQKFLDSNDAGRDGAFVGRWDKNDSNYGESTIQCKFTSKKNINLTLSMLQSEFAKVKKLVDDGLATDYIIMTNYSITGANEAKIKAAFKNVGVKVCRVFGYEDLNKRIKESPKVRMMVPRLYGLGDLNTIFDNRAYQQAKLILSSMGGDLNKIVITDAYRKSIKAVHDYNIVLLLGEPASGKSTIGASIALAALDSWGLPIIKVTTPEDIKKHLDVNIKHFFWVDDAWGSTQYKQSTAEEWNKIFPLMRSVMKIGTKFIITSRDYIWEAAKEDLKIQDLPALKEHEVIIKVEELNDSEKAHILYNHLKFGEQSKIFRTKIKKHLPSVVKVKEFLPEAARRLSNPYFTKNFIFSENYILDFFKNPKEFLCQIIENLSNDCKATIATIYINGGKIYSPIPVTDMDIVIKALGSSEGAIRKELERLKGSLLLFAHDNKGPYWTYKHPTISDAFTSYLATKNELIELYLRGAKPDLLIDSVACAGINLNGSPIIVPTSLNELLLKKIMQLPVSELRHFIIYRSNVDFTKLLLTKRSDVFDDLHFNWLPFDAASDVKFLIKLYEENILPDVWRDKLVRDLLSSLMNHADSCVFTNASFKKMLTNEEKSEALSIAKDDVITNIALYVRDLWENWDNQEDPYNYFDDFKLRVLEIIDVLEEEGLFPDDFNPRDDLETEIDRTISRMYAEYKEPIDEEDDLTLSEFVNNLNNSNEDDDNIFRDVDE